MMGSGAEAAEETVARLDQRGETVGLLKVRLYRPFSVEHFVAALPGPCGRSPCWIGRRSRAPPASRSIWTS